MEGLTLAELTKLYQEQTQCCRVAYVAKREARKLAIDAILEGHRDLQDAEDWWEGFDCHDDDFMGFTGMGYPVSRSAFRAALNEWRKYPNRKEQNG